MRESKRRVSWELPVFGLSLPFAGRNVVAVAGGAVGAVGKDHYGLLGDLAAGAGVDAPVEVAVHPDVVGVAPGVEGEDARLEVAAFGVVRRDGRQGGVCK